uniref:Uncharacterized protein n=1 Tax=Romanomermis culicivorax TaxID=13658 RepID=A0A915HUF7_ROMCU
MPKCWALRNDDESGGAFRFSLVVEYNNHYYLSGAAVSVIDSNNQSARSFTVSIIVSLFKICLLTFVLDFKSNQIWVSGSNSWEGGCSDNLSIRFDQVRSPNYNRYATRHNMTLGIRHLDGMETSEMKKLNSNHQKREQHDFLCYRTEQQLVKKKSNDIGPTDGTGQAQETNVVIEI